MGKDHTLFALKEGTIKFATLAPEGSTWLKVLRAWNKEIIASLAFILIILIYLKQKYYKNEIFVLLFGIIIGALIELYGAYFVGFQIFQSQYTKIPLWLPLAWGYAFVAMRRIGNIIIGK